MNIFNFFSKAVRFKNFRPNPNEFSSLFGEKDFVPRVETAPIDGEIREFNNNPDDKRRYEALRTRWVDADKKEKKQLPYTKKKDNSQPEDYAGELFGQKAEEEKKKETATQVTPPIPQKQKEKKNNSDDFFGGLFGQEEKPKTEEKNTPAVKEEVKKETSEEKGDVKQEDSIEQQPKVKFATRYPKRDVGKKQFYTVKLDNGKEWEGLATDVAEAKKMAIESVTGKKQEPKQEPKVAQEEVKKEVNPSKTEPMNNSGGELKVGTEIEFRGLISKNTAIYAIKGFKEDGTVDLVNKEIGVVINEPMSKVEKLYKEQSNKNEGSEDETIAGKFAMNFSSASERIKFMSAYESFKRSKSKLNAYGIDINKEENSSVVKEIDESANKLLSLVPNLHVGDIKIIEGITYRLNENHRWERVNKDLTNSENNTKLQETKQEINNATDGTEGTDTISGQDNTRGTTVGDDTIRDGSGETTDIGRAEEGLHEHPDSTQGYSNLTEVRREDGELGRQQAVRGTDEDTAGNRADELVGEADGETDGRLENYDLRTAKPIILKPSERRSFNKEAKEIIASGKKPEELTENEKYILSLYTGEGGLSSGTKEALNQHYTSYPVIKAIFGAIKNAGYKFKTALEPAVGSGNFIGISPEADWTAVDIDETNTKVAGLLYPKAKVYKAPYQDFNIGGYDLVVSNVPFLERLPGQKYALHDFYFLHSLDLVEEDGLVAFVTSKGTMDKASSKVREEIVAKGDVLACYRLPSTTFEGNASTSVITDLIILQKRPASVSAEESKNKANNDLFINSDETDDGIRMNNYYQEKPQNLLGDLEVGVSKLYGGKDYTLTGEADLSKIKFDYEPYNKGEKKPKQVKPVVTETQTIEKLTKDNVKFRTSKDSNFKDNSYYDKVEGKLYELDKEIVTDDTSLKIKTFKEVSNSNLSLKTTMLNKLQSIADNKQAGERIDQEEVEKIIEDYKTNFDGVHPLKDKELIDHYQSQNSYSSLQTLGTLFDKDFKPAEVFLTQTKYKDSGKIQATKDSPLLDRAVAQQDMQGIITFKKSNERAEKNLNVGDTKTVNGVVYQLNENHRWERVDGVKESEIRELLANGYSLLDEETVQNDILYFSGNIAEKIENAQSMADRSEDEQTKSILESQISRLKAILPPKVDITKKRFKGNESILTEFWKDFGISKNADGDFEVSRSNEFPLDTDEEQMLGKYLSGKRYVPTTITRNKETIPIDPEDIKRMLISANRKIGEWRDYIQDKIATDETLRNKLEEQYNAKFNSYVRPDYLKIADTMLKPYLDELPAELNGKPFALRQNQVNWVCKALTEGKGINSHDVGGGKTKTAIVLARVLKAKGIANKPVFVVPAKTIKNWEREILEMYPNAKIINLGNLPKDVRNEKLLEVANQNADYVLITQEGFGKISLPDAVEGEYFEEMLAETQGDDSITGRQKAIKGEKEANLKAIIESNSNAKDSNISLDKLGFDCIIADEAHAYKNIGSNKSVANSGGGIPLTMKKKEIKDKDGKVIEEESSISSARSYDFRFKARFISEMNNDKNVFLLTATPTDNKVIELYNMIRHVDGGALANDYGIYSDKDFFNTFFETEQIQNELKIGKNKNAVIITKVKDATTLRKITDRFIDKIAMADMPWIKVPDTVTKMHLIEPSVGLQQVSEDVKNRMNSMKGKKEKGDDTTIAVYQTFRAASVNETLYSGEHAGLVIPDRTHDVKTDKIEKCISLVTKAYSKNKNAGQIIFLDAAGHKALSVNMHKQIKQELIKKGYKESEIAIISGQETTNPVTGREIKATGAKLNELKQNIADAYNAGQIKVVIGTTASAGEGMNLQKTTTDIYHLDIPYKPGAIQQRNGRGVRFGNVNDKVNVHFFFAENTFDRLSYDIVKGKKGWNDAIWSKEIEDEIDTREEMMEGGIPTESEIKIQLAKDPAEKYQLIVTQKQDKLIEKFNNSKSEVGRIGKYLQSARDSMENLESSIKRGEKQIAEDKNRAEFFGNKNSYRYDKDYAEEYKSKVKKNTEIVKGWKSRYATKEKQISRYTEELSQAKLNAESTEKEVKDFVKRYMGSDNVDMLVRNINIPKEETNAYVKDYQLKEVERKQAMLKDDEDDGFEKSIKIFGKRFYLSVNKSKKQDRNKNTITIFNKSIKFFVR